jgi:hypothetical protein
MTDPVRPADDVTLAEQVEAANGVYLFAEFTETMGRLGRKYGTVNVQEQARSWVAYIDKVRARIDGSSCGVTE